MKILVTGASGFLGRSVVRISADSGHNVTALIRPLADASRLGWPDGVSVLRGDLRQPGEWCEKFDAEVVIHLAAAPSGDLATQFAGTVQATENLFEHMNLKSIKRFVHISSFSVYDFSSLPINGMVDESTPMEPSPEARDFYTITKMAQERLVIESCKAAGTDFLIIRPGAIYGPGKTWDYGTALSINLYDLIFSPNAIFRLTYVDNCAEAIVKAVSAPIESGRIFNIVDDDLPTFKMFHDKCRLAGAPTGRPVRVPWFLLSGLGRAVRLLNRIAFGNRAKLPEILEYRRQQARWKPLRYANQLAKAELDWFPKIGLEEGIALMTASDAISASKDSVHL